TGRLAVAILALGLLSSRASAQLVETEFRADDGTAYQVIRAIAPIGVGAEKVRITTLAGSSSGVGGCVLSQNMPGQIAAAIAGPLPPGQALHPYNSILRTAILAPDNINAVAFDETFGGRVTLGTTTPLNICRTNFDCTGHPNQQTLVGLNN